MATAPNPNPSRITDPFWRLWLACQAAIPGVRLSGIFADKRCYHNTVTANLAKWPGAYCVQLPLDRSRGPRDKARAIDLTMSDAEMRKRTGYLRASALDPRDDRLRAVREFYGTLDGKTVYGLMKDDEDGPWRSASSDTSHLWHIHIGVFTAFCDDWAALSGIASVLSGETYDQWLGQKGAPDLIYFVVSNPGPGWVGVTSGVPKTAYHMFPTMEAFRDHARTVGLLPNPDAALRRISLADFEAGKYGVAPATLVGQPGPAGPPGDGLGPFEVRAIAKEVAREQLAAATIVPGALV